jgi:serine/threonine protein kinase/Flp pilus assembly protein TadD
VRSTQAIPDRDTHVRPPAPDTDARSSEARRDVDSDGPPTIRFPVRPTAAAQPGLPSLVPTPTPASDLDFSGSVWNALDGSDGSEVRRNPRIGDTLFGFKLVGELGRGAFARVYLAHQEALAGRPVALKVTFRPTREPQRLARLQHTNIVPVYSVHDEGAVQVICMPFLGRVTVADLIRAYRVEHPSRHSGRRSTSARAARTTAPESKSKGSGSGDSRGGAQRPPVWTWSAGGPPPIVGDPRAVLQVLAQLADGLAHAHARGILHLDLKPANVLLADSGEPMLLDFNLSYDAAQPKRELVGGTMPYMAIEQLLDMRDRGRGLIDARTDLYALGVMAYEMLTGAVPFPSAVKDCRDLPAQVEARRRGPPPIRERNPDVTPAVEAIILKLLAPDPADRYQSADELKTDIDRHLGDLPLLFAPERSHRERWGKWRRRNPRVAGRLLLVCVVGLAVGLGALAYHREEASARHRAVARATEARAALDTVRLDLVLPDDRRARARGDRRATELLAEYGLPGADWQRRPDVRRLCEAERADLTGDLGELLFLLARARWDGAEALPEPDLSARAADVWKLITAARGCFGAGAAPAALDRLAALVAPVAGEPFDPPAGCAAEPQGARAMFLDGVLALTQGRYAGAAELLERAVAAHPDHAAAQYCLAYCRQQAGQFHRALERYDVARARLPGDPRPVYQRGVIYGLLRKPGRAEVEFTKALELDPDLADAYRHRALARYRLGAPKCAEPGRERASADALAGAETDLTAALERGAPALFVYFVRARVREARGDKAGAAADAAAAKEFELSTEADYLVRGWTRIEGDPTGARADFERAAELNPRSLQALQNLAHVLADRLKDNQSALAVATRVADLYPEFGPAVSGRAVVLARLGRRADAHKEIEKARLLSDDPQITYQAASVYALTSSTHPADRPRALALLRQALRDGYGDVRGLATDPDFDPLRKTSEFLDIQQAAKTLAR